MSELIGGTASTALAVGALVETGSKLDVLLQSTSMTLGLRRLSQSTGRT